MHACKQCNSNVLILVLCSGPPWDVGSSSEFSVRGGLSLSHLDLEAQALLLGKFHGS